MNGRYIPVEPDGQHREPATGTQYVMRSLLASRLEVGMPSDADPGEQEVNVYLTQLLCAYGDPRYCLRVGSFISTYDTTVFERAQHSPSHRFRYTVYKINADHLLMSIGVFQNPEGRPVDSLPAVWRRSGDTFVGRGKTYYDFASTYSQRVFGRTSAVADVLGKLSAGFERYVRLLAHLRTEYFDIVARLSDGELYHLERAARAEGVHELRDEFLDAYSSFRRDPTAEARSRLLEVTRRLEAADPEFRFDLGE